LIDDHMLLGLRNGSGLKMMKGSTIPINLGAVYVEGIGYQTDGLATYINLGLDLGIDSIKYLLNDALLGGYVKSQAEGTNGSFFGVGDSLNNAYTQIYQTSTIKVNFITNRNAGGDTGSSLGQEQLVLVARDADVNNNLWRNGLRGNSDILLNSPNIPTGSTVGIGARIDDNVPVGFKEMLAQSFVFGGAVGFPHLDYYKALQSVQAKIALGETVKDILIYDRPLLTADDIRRVYAYINEPVGQMTTLLDYEARALDNFIRDEKSI
jgi:hypothetical protein